MRKVYFIIPFIVLAFALQESLAQQSATAVMEVSVRIIESTHVNVEQPALITLKKQGRSNLGQLNMKGIDKTNTLISFSDNTRLDDNRGNSIDLEISSEQLENGNESTFRLFGTADNTMRSGLYRGKVTTRIEYL